MKLDLTGPNTLLITPFMSNGYFDTLSFKKLINFVLNEGATGLILLGSTGEFFGLTHSERMTIIKEGISHIDKKVPVTVGIGSDGTAGSIELAKFAEKSGADCLMVIPPIYFDTSPNAQIKHYVTIAKEVDIPIMLYDGANGIRVTPEITAKAHRMASNISYIKIASPDPRLFPMFKQIIPQVIPIVGEDMMLLQGLKAGGMTSSTAIGNILPKQITQLHKAFRNGDIDTARKISINLAPITMNLSIPKTLFIAKFKYILFKNGVIDSDFVRSPLIPLTNAERTQIDEDVQPSIRLLL